MLTGVDHVIVAVADLEAASAEVTRELGVTVVAGGAHPGFGTRNCLSWWGTSYLELVAIADPEVAAGTWFGAAVLAALAAGGAAGTIAAPLGLALASNDLGRDAAALGHTVTPGSRTAPDGRTVRWRMARAVHRPEAAGPWPLLFLIEHDLAAAEWTPADRMARAAAVHPLGTAVRLRSVTFALPVVPVAVGRLGREFLLAFRPSLVGGGARDASIGGQTLRLAPARVGAPLMTIDLIGGDAPRELDLLGCRWRLTPPVEKRA